MLYKKVKKRMKRFGNVLWGVVLILIGIIVALNALGVTSINIFFSGWWTLFIIIPNFIGLFKSESKVWNFIWLVIGVVFLLAAQQVISFTMISRLIFPFILVTIGISIIFKDVIGKNVGDKIKELNKGKVGDQLFATFGGQERRYTEEEFFGASLDAVFGGVELDITRAIITKDQVINATAVFGGVEILVPTNVNIKVKSTPIFGGTSNNVRTKYDENLPTIYINSTAIFGGVDIK